MPILVRTARAADIPALILLDNTNFGFDQAERGLAGYAEVFRVADARLALDGGQAVGMALTSTMTVTVPGGAQLGARAVASASTAPTHRRRGVLRALLADIHTEARAAGLPLAILTATEGGIYGRFGYGPASVWHWVSVDRRFVEFHPGTPDPGGVRIAPLTEAARLVPAIYERWRRQVPGAQQRPDANWDDIFADYQDRRNGGTALFALLHSDGYALYRYSNERGTDSRIMVTEWQAITADAHIALWRALTSFDLYDSVQAIVAPDDPLPRLLVDPRVVRTTAVRDALWLRLLDVPAALAARRYAGDLDIVLDVADPALDSGGRFRLRVADGAARCAPTDRPADLALDIDVLGSLYLGAFRARDFVAANRLRGKDVATIREFDAALATERAPQLGWFF